MEAIRLISLFPAAFLLHELEEVVWGENWLRRNGAEVQAKLSRWAPKVVRKAFGRMLTMSTAEMALTVTLMFVLVSLASYAAVVWDRRALFSLASAMFFVHGIGHVAQAIALKRYVPGVATSIVAVIPYGAAVLWAGATDGRDLAAGAVLLVPFIWAMQRLGGLCWKLVSAKR